MNRNIEDARKYLKPYLDFFMSSLDSEEFQRNVGKWALVGGETSRISAGFYDRWEEAIGAGYQEFGLSDFLVRQITSEDRLFGARRLVGFGERGKSLVKLVEIPPTAMLS